MIRRGSLPFRLLSRVVNKGSSEEMVPMPTMTASTSSLRWWTYSLDFSFVTHRESTAGGRRPSVQGHGRFRCHKRAPGRYKLDKSFIETPTLLLQSAGDDFNPLPCKKLTSAAGHVPVGVFHPDHHLSDAASQNRFRTWGCSALVVAWLQSDIKDIPLLLRFLRAEGELLFRRDGLLLSYGNRRQ